MNRSYDHIKLFCTFLDGEFSKDFLKSLVVVLSHLFARRKLHRMLLRRQRSTSKVILDDLPDTFQSWSCEVQQQSS